MKVDVITHSEVNGNHVSDVYLLHQSSQVIILEIGLDTKHKEPNCYSSEDGIESFWIGDDEVIIELPKDFNCGMIIAQTWRYTCYVFLFRGNLFDQEKELWSKEAK